MPWRTLVRLGFAGIIDAVVYHADVLDAAWTEEPSQDGMHADDGSRFQ